MLLVYFYQEPDGSIYIGVELIVCSEQCRGQGCAIHCLVDVYSIVFTWLLTYHFHYILQR